MALRKKNSKTAEIAEPVREFLRRAIKRKIRTNQDRARLGEFLGQAPSSVSNLLKGEGGLDTWAAALVFCYQIDAEAMVELIENYSVLIKKHKPSESDRLAAQIDLPENKRKILFSALLTALSIGKDD